MLKSEFERELSRLSSGYGLTLLHPRVDAFWSRFGHVLLADWQRAISDALLDPRFPTGPRLSELIERQSEHRHRLILAATERDATRLYLSGDLPAETPLCRFYGRALPICASKPKGRFAQTMADLLADWIATDPAYDRYVPEAAYWLDLAASQEAPGPTITHAPDPTPTPPAPPLPGGTDQTGPDSTPPLSGGEEENGWVYALPLPPQDHA